MTHDEKRVAMRRHDEMLAKREAIYNKAIAEGREMTASEKREDAELQQKANELHMQIEAEQIRDERNGGLPRDFDMLRLYAPNEPSEPAGSMRSSSGPFKSFGEYLQAIMRAGFPGQRVDPRLHEIQDAERRASGLNETIPSEGAFLVQQDFGRQLIGSVYQTGLLAGRCLRYTISERSNAIKVPGIDETSRATGSRYGGVRVYNIAEAAEKQASKPKFREIELKLGKKIGLCYATDELLEDASLLEQVVTNSFRQEMAFVLDDEVINGTGAGMFLGILNAPAKIRQDKEVGQPADTLLYENLLHIIARYNGSMQRGVWLANKDILPTLFNISIAIGVGGELVFKPGDVARGQAPVLLGFPVIWMEQCSTLGDEGDLILADPGAYAIADKATGIQTASSIHVKFVYDETAFRFVYRCDGQPIYASAVIPYKGTATQSPFVTLEDRT